MNTLLGAMRGAMSIHMVRIRRKRGMSAAIDSENWEVWSIPLSRHRSWNLAALDIMVGKSDPDYATSPIRRRSQKKKFNVHGPRSAVIFP